jgi:threonine/homoserine efflux transporter RhtA
MCGVAFSYSSIEVVAKYLVLTLPVLQVVWLRFLTHAVLGTLVLAPQYGWRLFQVNDWRLQIARGVMVAVMTVLNIWALVYLQLDITGAIQFTVPILVAVDQRPAGSASAWTHAAGSRSWPASAVFC